VGGGAPLQPHTCEMQSPSTSHGVQSGLGQALPALGAQTIEPTTHAQWCESHWGSSVHECPIGKPGSHALPWQSARR